MDVKWILVTRDYRVGFESLTELTEFARDFGIKNWRPEMVALTNSRALLDDLENRLGMKV